TATNTGKGAENQGFAQRRTADGHPLSVCGAHDQRDKAKAAESAAPDAPGRASPENLSELPRGASRPLRPTFSVTERLRAAPGASAWPWGGRRRGRGLRRRLPGGRSLAPGPG